MICTKMVQLSIRLSRKVRALPVLMPTFKLSVSYFLKLKLLLVKIKVEVDGRTVFEDPKFEDLEQIEVGVDAHKFDLEEY